MSYIIESNQLKSPEKFKGLFWKITLCITGIVLVFGLFMYLDRSGIIDINKMYNYFHACRAC